MKNKLRNVYERVYIHTAKAQTAEGWVLVIHSMDAVSEFAFETTFNITPDVTVNVLSQLFDNILIKYNPLTHPKQIQFVTNLSEEYHQLIQQTKAAKHKFIYNSEATTKAMKKFLDSLRIELVNL